MKSHLVPPNLSSLVESWLKEDCPSFDVGGYVVGEEEQIAFLFQKSPVTKMTFIL